VIEQLAGDSAAEAAAGGKHRCRAGPRTDALRLGAEREDHLVRDTPQTLAVRSHDVEQVSVRKVGETLHPGLPAAALESAGEQHCVPAAERGERR